MPIKKSNAQGDTTPGTSQIKVEKPLKTQTYKQSSNWRNKPEKQRAHYPTSSEKSGEWLRVGRRNQPISGRSYSMSGENRYLRQQVIMLTKLVRDLTSRVEGLAQGSAVKPKGSKSTSKIRDSLKNHGQSQIGSKQSKDCKTQEKRLPSGMRKQISEPNLRVVAQSPKTPKNGARGSTLSLPTKLNQKKTKTLQTFADVVSGVEAERSVPTDLTPISVTSVGEQKDRLALKSRKLVERDTFKRPDRQQRKYFREHIAVVDEEFRSYLCYQFKFQVREHGLAIRMMQKLQTYVSFNYDVKPEDYALLDTMSEKAVIAAFADLGPLNRLRQVVKGLDASDEMRKQVRFRDGDPGRVGLLKNIKGLTQRVESACAKNVVGN